MFFIHFFLNSDEESIRPTNEPLLPPFTPTPSKTEMSGCTEMVLT